MEWFRFSHLECLCFAVCVRLCMCVNNCVRVRCPLLQKKKDFVRSTRPGEIMAIWRRWSTRLLCSQLLGLSLVQLLARGQRSGTLGQGALTRLDPWIELQRIQKERRETFNISDLTLICSHLRSSFIFFLLIRTLSTYGYTINQMN